MGTSPAFISRGHTDRPDAGEKIAIISSTASHLLSYLSAPLFPVVSVEKGNLSSQGRRHPGTSLPA